MKITLRLVVALSLAVAGAAGLFSRAQVSGERARLESELDRRARMPVEALRKDVELLLAQGVSAGVLGRRLDKFFIRERLGGAAVYDRKGNLLAASSVKNDLLLVPTPPLRNALAGKVSADFEGAGMGRLRLVGMPLDGGGVSRGALILFQDAGPISSRVAMLWRRAFLRVLLQFFLITLVTLWIVRWSVQGPIAQTAEWMKRLRAGEVLPLPPSHLSREGVLAPLVKEVSTFAQHLALARTAAGEEARLRRRAEALWTPEKLKEVLKNNLQGKPLLVVSNREPYMHVRRGRKVDCVIPAGGLVTALDPVLRSADGLWIAHGSGDADFEMVDDKNRLRVPPEDPQYTLKRVPLTPAEEDGYYYGFANEGIWPLCHNAYARPTFRPTDWEQYRAVNAKFAEETLEEIAGWEDPLILIQDYHFALLPRMVRERRPDARIALFWHIPWPNPEAFGICPWQKEILDGMLGADLVGFHTQFHCNNFLDTVDRTLECRIEWERFTVHRGDQGALVKPFPISVEFAPPPAGETPQKSGLLRDLGVPAEFLAVGVDRVDYTKGILEKFRAVEHLLEVRPEYQGRFVLVQIGAPSRTRIPRYAEFLAEVDREAGRINGRFRAGDWQPIQFLKRLHTPEEIRPFYKRADLCLVTSLHDGMNLVAKEFVAARDDVDGVLVLSRFAGAARELADALIVNPYDVQETADALHRALTMEPDERRARMARLRASVRENNIYRWAGNLVLELTQLPSRRTESPV